jgi:hypothetical protein
MADDNTGSWMDFAQRSRDDGGLGLERHQAAGVVGNLQNESGSGVPSWGPTGDNGTAWGSAQWRNDRLDNLKAHAQANGLDYRTPEAQQAFMRHEFDTSENGAYQALQAAQTPEQAAAAVDARYERSDGSTRPQRMAAARRLFDGSSGPTAIDAAMGRTRSTGSRMAFAPTDDEETPTAPPALSAAATLGPGQLGANPAGAPAPKNWLDILGTTLMNMAPGIAQDPENKRALVEAANAANKATVDQGTWSHITLPNGQIARINSKQGIPQVMDPKTGAWEQAAGNYAKDDSKWGILRYGPDGKPVYGYTPTQDAYAATQTPEAKAAAAAADAAAHPEAGLTGQPFIDALNNKDATYSGRVKAIAEGRADLPVGRAAMEGTPGGQLVKDVMTYDPTYEQGNAKARSALRSQYEASSAPNSPANMIKVSGTAMHHGGLLSDAIENFKGFNDHYDSSIPYGSWALNSVHNSQLAGQSTPEAQAYAAAVKMRENYGDEVAKFYGGGPAGEHAKQRAIENLDFAKSLPELRSIMAADMDMIHGKASTLQDAWRTGMRGSTVVPDFPVVSQESQANVDKIKSRYEQTKEAGSYTGPNAKATPGVPKKDRPQLNDIFK